MGLASDSRDYAAIKNKTSRSLIIKEYEKKMLLNLYNPLKIKKNNKIKDKNTASSVEEIKMTLFDDGAITEEEFQIIKDDIMNMI